MNKKLNYLKGITRQHTRNANANTAITPTKVGQADIVCLTFYREKKSGF
jgi:hypothetical protein